MQIFSVGRSFDQTGRGNREAGVGRSYNSNSGDLIGYVHIMRTFSFGSELIPAVYPATLASCTNNTQLPVKANLDFTFWIRFAISMTHPESKMERLFSAVHYPNYIIYRSFIDIFTVENGFTEFERITNHSRKLLDRNLTFYLLRQWTN